MKRNFSFIERITVALTVVTVLTILVAVEAFAALPTYHTTSATGNHTAGALATFPADPNSQIRIIYVNYGGDTNNAFITFASGTTQYSVTSTNLATSAVTNLLDSTNGLAGGQTLALQHNGTLYENTIATGGFGLWASTYVTNGAIIITNNTWYVTLSSGGWGVWTSVSDNVWNMTTTTSWPVPLGTNVIAGDAIFVGNYGCPVTIQISPDQFTNNIYSASSHYDSASQ